MRMGLSIRKKNSPRLASLVAALAVAMTPLTTVATAQAAVSLRQGAAIAANSDGWAGCALSVADSSTAYTALHCGEGQWRVGDPIKLPSGKTIGTISALGSDLPDGQQLDAVKIDLVPGVQVQDSFAGVGDSDALRKGDPVTIYAPGTRNTGVMVNTQPVWRSLKSDNLYPSFLISATVQTFGGNSGGALLNERNELVGVLAGGNAKDRSYYTPINKIRALLG